MMCRTSLHPEGLQSALLVGLGSAILLACILPPHVWTVFATKAFTPAMTVMLLFILRPRTLGMAVSMLPVLLFGMFLACLGYCIVDLIAWAATGPEFAPGPTKAGVIMTLAAVVVGLLHLIRVKLPLLASAAKIGQVFIAISSFHPYWRDGIKVCTPATLACFPPHGRCRCPRLYYFA